MGGIVFMNEKNTARIAMDLDILLYKQKQWDDYTVGEVAFGITMSLVKLLTDIVDDHDVMKDTLLEMYDNAVLYHECDIATEGQA